VKRGAVILFSVVCAAGVVIAALYFVWPAVLGASSDLAVLRGQLQEMRTRVEEKIPQMKAQLHRDAQTVGAALASAEREGREADAHALREEVRQIAASMLTIEKHEKDCRSTITKLEVAVRQMERAEGMREALGPDYEQVLKDAREVSGEAALALETAVGEKIGHGAVTEVEIESMTERLMRGEGPPAPSPVTSEGGGGRAIAGGGGYASPQALIGRFVEAMERGDGAAVRAMFHATTRAEQNVARLAGDLADFLGELADLRRGAAQKFGPQASASVPFGDMAQELDGLSRAAVQTDGERAWIANARGGIYDMRMQRIGGAWYIAVNERAIQDFARLDQELLHMRSVIQATRGALSYSRSLDEFRWRVEGLMREAAARRSGGR